MKLGKTKLGGERKEIFTIKDNDNIYRPLPPMGKLADKGVFSRYFRVVWGYKDSQGKLRPFVSPRVQNFKTKMVEVDCAAFNRVQTLKTELETLTKEVKALAGAGTAITAAQKKRLEELTELVGRKGRFNIDSKHHMNVVAQDGRIGCLKLAGRGFQAMKALFKTLEGKGVDASGVEGGRFLNINRQGTGLDTVYTVTELKETINVEGHGEMEKAIPHDLTDAIIGRLAAEAYELDEIYPFPTEAEVKEIVAAQEISDEAAGVVIDRIFGSRESTETPAETKTETPVETKVETPAETKVEAKVETKVEETVNETTGEITETPAETKVEAKVEETPAAETAPTNPAVESDEDFLAGLGVKLG